MKHPVCCGLIVSLRYHRFVSKYIKKRNKIDVLWEDIEKAIEAVMKYEKKVR
jgi:hypothetical protein